MRASCSCITPLKVCFRERFNDRAIRQIPLEALQRTGESNLQFKAMCADAATDTLFVSFTCNSGKEQETLASGVRAVSISSGELAAHDVFTRTGDQASIKSVGFVRATGTLLVYSNEEVESRMYSWCLVTVAMNEKNEWVVQKQSQLEDRLLSHPNLFCELTPAKIICGESGFAADTSQVLRIFEVSPTHQIKYLQRFTTPRRYGRFDARFVSGRSLVALANTSERTVFVYELQANSLSILYKFCVTERPPAHVLWFGDCPLVAQLSERVQLIARLSAIISNANSSNRLHSAGNRVAVYEDKNSGHSGSRVLIFSVDEV